MITFCFLGLPFQFDNMKVAEAQNTEALQSGKAELKQLIKDKRNLDNMIYAWLQKVIKKKKLIHTQSLHREAIRKCLSPDKQDEQQI